jgi:hypothetical protein
MRARVRYNFLINIRVKQRDFIARVEEERREKVRVQRALQMHYVRWLYVMRLERKKIKIKTIQYAGAPDLRIR